jgi:hypothetical protein
MSVHEHDFRNRISGPYKRLYVNGLAVCRHTVGCLVRLNVIQRFLSARNMSTNMFAAPDGVSAELRGSVIHWRGRAALRCLNRNLDTPEEGSLLNNWQVWTDGANGSEPRAVKSRPSSLP